MPTTKLSTKAEMYAALAAGRLGNTLPQYFDFETWFHKADIAKYPLWGVRSFVPGGPGAMYLDHFDTYVMLRDLRAAGTPFNVSPMIDGVTLMCNVGIMAGVGLYCDYVEHPPAGVSWRALFGTPGVARHAHGVAAYKLLRTHLNENAYDDIDTLLSMYEDHVVEFSATSHCIGQLPHRNYVTWEVRAY